MKGNKNSKHLKILDKTKEENLPKSYPENPIYSPYIKCISKNKKFDLGEEGEMLAIGNKGNEYQIANFVARPVKEIVKDNSLEIEKYLEITGILKGGRLLPTIQVPIDDFDSMSWPLNKWGIQAIISSSNGAKSLVREMIQHMGEGIERVEIYQHLGWRRLQNGEYVFLHSNGCIGDGNAYVEIDEELNRYCLPNQVTDIKKATIASYKLQSIAPLQITMPMIAMVYLAPLLEAARRANIEPKFLLWIYGMTGSQKTSLNLVFLSHFGQFVNHPPASFKDTFNAIEKRTFLAKDVLMLVDDYHPSTNRNQKLAMDDIAQKILRIYGDRVGRGRMKANTDLQKTYRPMGLATVTGEDIPKGQSSVARFLGVEVKPGEVNLEKLSVAQENVEYLQEAMVGYIKWLIPQMDELPTKLQGMFTKYRIEFKQHVHGRLVDAAAWLCIGYEMMLEFMKSISVLSAQKAEVRLSNAKKILTSMIQQQHKLVSEDKPVEIFIKSLAYLIANSKIHARNLEDKDHELLLNNPVVFYDKDYYYLKFKNVMDEVNKLQRIRGKEFPVSEYILLKNLEEENMIRVEKDSNGKVHRTIKKKIPSTNKLNDRPRLLHLHRDALDIEISNNN